MNQVREWKSQAAQAGQKLDESEQRIIDIAKRLSRLEAQVEVAERSANKRRGQP